MIFRSLVQISVIVAMCTLTSCRVMEFTGDTIEFTGKVASAALKTTGAAVETTGKVVTTTGKLGGSTARFIAGDRKVTLERRGNSFYVEAVLNRRYRTRLLLDTGATNVQISKALARRMGVNSHRGREVNCTLADGSVTRARLINLAEVKLGGVKVRDVETLVLEADSESDHEGLLGMSFLNHFNFRIDTDRNLLLLRSKEKR